MAGYPGFFSDLGSIMMVHVQGAWRAAINNLRMAVSNVLQLVLGGDSGVRIHKQRLVLQPAIIDQNFSVNLFQINSSGFK